MGCGDERLSRFQLQAHCSVEVSLSFSYEDSGLGVAFCQTHCSPYCAFIAFPRTVPTIFISFLLGDNEK